MNSAPITIAHIKAYIRKDRRHGGPYSVNFSRILGGRPEKGVHWLGGEGRPGKIRRFAFRLLVWATAVEAANQEARRRHNRWLRRRARQSKRT